MPSFNRRHFLQSSALASLAAGGFTPGRSVPGGPRRPVNQLRFGLVTYLWGKDMDLPTVIATCEQSGLQGVELRTEHKHGVEPKLSKAERLEVRRRFEDSPVELVGYGSNAEFHAADLELVQANIELAKQYIQLMHDCGGSGVKVKPNGFVSGVPRENTIEQIGRALNEVAEYGQQYGQQIRVEVHGKGTSELPVMKAILDVADHPNVAVCWNSNPDDLAGDGLEHNFNLVKDRFGKTVHVHELTTGPYPWDQLFHHLLKMVYDGWILLEASSDPADKITALIEQRRAFETLLSAAVV